MKTYSRLARLFLTCIWLCGLAAAASSFLLPDSGKQAQSPILLALTLLLAFAAGSRTVTLVRSPRLSEQCTVSLGFFVTFFCLLAFGPRACVWAAIISSAGASIFPRRLPWPQLLFNVSALAVTATITACTYLYLQTQAPVWIRQPFLLTLLAASVYFLINSGFLAAVITLCSSQKLRDVWKSLIWTAPSYLAGASVAMLLHLWVGTNTNLFLMLPVLAFLQQSYQTHMDKLEESRRHLEQRERYIEELQESRKSLADLYTSTVRSLASAIDAKDQGMHAHILRVQVFAVGIARVMGIEGAEAEAIRMGALLHDIGKISVPDHILLKPGPLTDDEWRQMKQHCVIGAEILEPVHFPTPVISVVRHHHERWDGCGYPDALSGTAIPLGARVMTVADVYDALTSDRPYRTAWSRERALAYIENQANIQFDPEVVAALNQYLTQEETGANPADAQRPDQAQSQRAMQSIQRSTSKTGTLYDIAQLLNTSMPLEERMERVCQRTAAALPDTDCAIVASRAVVESSGQKSRLFVPDTELPADTLHLLAAAGTRGAIFCRSAFLGTDGLIAKPGRQADHPSLFKQKAEAESPSFVTVPLIYGEETLGMVCVFHPKAGALAEEVQDLVRGVADQVQRDLYHHIQFQRTQCEAMTDLLTGLPNIRYLAAPANARAAESASASLMPPFSVLYLDLDDFKPVNDTFGHAEGDRVLKEIAHLLQQSLGSAGQIVRYGGDEFVVILPQAGASEAEAMTCRLQTAVRNYAIGRLSPTGDTVRMEVSIGMALSPSDGHELQCLIAIADARMYADKSRRKAPKHSAYAVVNSSLSKESKSAILTERV